MTKVALIKCEVYEAVKEAVRKSVDLIGGLEKYVRKGQRVLLKPNLINPSKREEAAVTDPIFLKAVIELVQEITPNVYVGDITAVDKQGTLAKVLKSTGILDVLKETGARIANLEKAGYIVVEIPGHKIMEKTDFSQAVVDFDVIINLPKFKSHCLTFVTGAVKNTFGLLHMGERQYLHSKFKLSDFCQGIVDVYSIVNMRMQLTIMDAVIGQEGDEGPSYGDPVKIGYVLASEDAVAMDAVMSKITGHDPLAILTTKHAHNRGLGQGNLDRIEIVGDKLEQVEFKKHSNYKSDSRKGLQPRIDNEKCTRCGNCFNGCPVNAIKDANGKYVIMPEDCIQCYCCVENCNYSAIKLEKGKENKKEKLQPGEGNKIGNLRLGLVCNQHCLFCTVADDDEKTLNFDEAKQQIDSLVENGVTILTITGGEPTIRDYLPELIRYAKEKGIDKVELQTNGVMFSNDEYLTRLKDAGLDYVLIAFHSHKPEVYEKITRTKYYLKAFKGIKNSVKQGMPTAISHVINKENYRDAVDFVKFIGMISKDIEFYFSFLRPNGNAMKNKWIVPKLIDIELEMYRLVEYCVKNNVRFSFEGMPLCYMQFYEDYSAETQRMGKPAQEYAGSEGRHADLHDFIHSELKAKSEVCKVCFLNSKCAGVWKEYAEIHGTDELFPVFRRI